MNDISIYFKAKQALNATKEESLGEKIIVHTEDNFPDIEKNSIALIYCPEYRNSNIELENRSQDTFLDAFAQLNSGESWDFKIYDLGSILPGAEIKDTYFALNQVITELIKHKVLPIIVGGSQDLTFAIYQAYQNLEQMVNITNVDFEFNLGNPEDEIQADAFVSKILMQRPCYLFNLSAIGIQAPYVKKSEIDLFDKLFFDTCRLGEFNADFKKAEPLIRNSDILSLDLNAIRKADFDNKSNNVNGFYADQICQIAKYAGISDKMSVFGLFNLEINSQLNQNLIAEILWYFLDGFANRKGDFPIGLKKDYTKFIVNLDAQENELIFYKSPKSNRWWMEVPYPAKDGARFERHHIVPCDIDDYNNAMKNEMPDLWWKTFQKLV